MSITLTAPVPSKEDRRAAFRQASWPRRVEMHEAIAAHKAEAIAARRELGQTFLAANPATYEVLFERAVGQMDLIAETAPARREAVALAVGRASQHDSGSLQYPLLAHDFPAESEAVRLGMSPLILAPIVRYFGMLPVLFNFFVTRAYQESVQVDSAHHFHLDPEDVISFKAFVQLTDVDDDCGPFHALPADHTQTVLKAVGYTGIEKLSDETIDGLAGWDKVVRFTGPAGTVALADTTRCLHFGGRPRAAGKPVRDMLVYQYLLPTSLLFPIDGDARHPNFLPQLSATGDPHWDALIGATLT